MDYKTLTVRFLQKSHAVPVRAYDKWVLDLLCVCCASLLAFGWVMVKEVGEVILFVSCWGISSLLFTFGEVLISIIGDTMLVSYWQSWWHVS